MIFQIKRLTIRAFEPQDLLPFFDLMGNPKVMNPIPLNALTRKESDRHFKELYALDSQVSEKKVWAITTTEDNTFIGLCAFIKNDENEDEIAYRLREQYWGKGYGTEVALGLLKYGFLQLKFEKITADVNIENAGSVKILEKFLKPVREFYNKRDKCTDRRYALSREAFLKGIEN